MAELKFKIGDKVEIISLENMFAPQTLEVMHKDLIGADGTIVAIDETDALMPYRLNIDWWVGDANIKLKS